VKPTQHWANNFIVEEDDVDFLVNYLLENETPLTSHALAKVLVTRRLEIEAAEIEERYKDAKIYSPAESYAPGTRVIFPAMEFAAAEVTGVRDGHNPELEHFKVIAVDFGDGKPREFAAEYGLPHQLSEEVTHSVAALMSDDMNADQILEDAGETIIVTVEVALQEASSLMRVARTWFPEELMLELSEGHLNLAEAVLDMMEGGPLTPEEIIENMGGLDENTPLSLQVFSLNAAMKKDRRFDEVGPSGQVLWYLVRMEPDGVQAQPGILRYVPSQYDHSLLDANALRVEKEIADELTDDLPLADAPEATITLIYPHRRAGTLPLNNKLLPIFPTAQRTDKIYITLVDAVDQETFVGWVVPQEQYIYGLLPLYEKYGVPVGAFINVRPGDEPGHIIIDFAKHRDRSEWVRLFVPRGETIAFENTKRPIGVDFDDLMILGIDELDAVDELASKLRGRPLPMILRAIIPEIGKLSPQGAAHAKTIYSALNVVRRCPPGPILAMLAANPDFENLGDNYWRVIED
jgi:hypothetical protein